MSLQDTGTLAMSHRKAVPIDQVDSGYASQDSSVPPTPEQKDAQRSVLPQRTNLHRFVPSFKRQSLSIPKNLNKYETTVEKAVWDRYHDIVERLQDGLKKCMNNKDGKMSQGLVIRLMVLGETYDKAKPYIIICCPKSKIKSVEEFLVQSSIKSLYQPNDPRQITFGIAVTGPPKPKSAGSDFDVYGSHDCPKLVGWSSSSAIIRVIGEDGKRYATMGGIIKISKSDGEYVLCGLTAGHILDTIDDNDDEENDDEEEMFTDEESESDQDDHTQNADVPTDSTKSTVAAAKADLELQSVWSRVGTITAESRPKEAVDRDWALVVGLDAKFQRSNKIQKWNGSSTPQPKRELTLGTEEAIPEGSTRAVVLASSILQKDANSQLGHLSNTGAVALFGADFVSVYTMTLENGACLPYGSSGSWVTDKDSCEIYGHAVADDAFGDIFVVPLRDIFADIENMEGVEAVTLPSDIDVMSHRSLVSGTMEIVPLTSTSPVSGNQESRVEEGSTMEVTSTQNPPAKRPLPSTCHGDINRMMERFLEPVEPIFNPNGTKAVPGLPHISPSGHPSFGLPSWDPLNSLDTIPMHASQFETPTPQGQDPQNQESEHLESSPWFTLLEDEDLDSSSWFTLSEDKDPWSCYDLSEGPSYTEDPEASPFFQQHVSPPPNLTPDTSLNSSPSGDLGDLGDLVHDSSDTFERYIYDPKTGAVASVQVERVSKRRKVVKKK